MMNSFRWRNENGQILFCNHPNENNKNASNERPSRLSFILLRGRYLTSGPRPQEMCQEGSKAIVKQIVGRYVTQFIVP